MKVVKSNGTYTGKIASDSGPEPLRLNTMGLIKVAQAIGLFGRSIRYASTDYDNFTESEKKRANELIQKGLNHINGIWEAMNNKQRKGN